MEQYESENVEGQEEDRGAIPVQEEGRGATPVQEEPEVNGKSIETEEDLTTGGEGLVTMDTKENGDIDVKEDVTEETTEAMEEETAVPPQNEPGMLRGSGEKGEW